LLKNANFQAPHWQKGFFDHVIRSQESLDQKWLYVRENSVRAGLVRSAEDWPYCWSIMRLSVLKEIGAVTDRAYSFPAPVVTG